jgi:hypothetical protein
MLKRAYHWFDRNVLELGRKLRLPPLMVYLAAGVSGLTAIVGTFFVKDYLGLSAEFLTPRDRSSARGCPLLRKAHPTAR